IVLTFGRGPDPVLLLAGHPAVGEDPFRRTAGGAILGRSAPAGAGRLRPSLSGRGIYARNPRVLHAVCPIVGGYASTQNRLDVDVRHGWATTRIKSVFLTLWLGLVCWFKSVLVMAGAGDAEASRRRRPAQEEAAGVQRRPAGRRAGRSAGPGVRE